MKQVSQIELETPLVPRAVAEAVLEEAGIWLEHPLPRHWIRELSARAKTVYAHNPEFRRRIHTKDNVGRDRLWIYTRHWLAALLQERRHHLFARLPQSYCVGEPLPGKPARAEERVAVVRRKKKVRTIASPHVHLLEAMSF